MNKKIYNNLTVENLTKTDWFNQFDKNKEVRERAQKRLNLTVVKKAY